MSSTRGVMLALVALVAGFSAPLVAARWIHRLMDSPARHVVVVPAPSRPAARAAAPAAASPGLIEVADGKRLYSLNCAPCHGLDGNGGAEFGAPALAGQRVWYLVRQLEAFREGRRGAHPADLQGMQMAVMLRLLADDRAIADVAAYLTSLPVFDVAPTLSAVPADGRAVFAGTCLPCHGERAQGSDLIQAPRLAGQADWYLVRQLTKFQAGVRGAHQEDTTGMQMAAMAKTIVDEGAIQDLAAYINSLQ